MVHTHCCTRCRWLGTSSANAAAAAVAAFTAAGNTAFRLRTPNSSRKSSRGRVKNAAADDKINHYITFCFVGGCKILIPTVFQRQGQRNHVCVLKTFKTVYDRQLKASITQPITSKRGPVENQSLA